MRRHPSVENKGWYSAREGSDKPPLNIVGTTTHRSSALGSVGPTAAATAFPSSNALDSVVVSSDVENAQEALVSDFVPVSVPVIKHIPKSARPACATHLKELLNNVVSNCKDIPAWLAVLYWSTIILTSPKRGGKKHNLTSVIKKRIASFDWQQACGDVNHQGAPGKHRDASADLAAAVASKLEDGNIRAAVRILCSEEKPVGANLDSLAQLEAKHPSPPLDRRQAHDPSSTTPISVEECDVSNAIRAFPAGSSGGPDGLRPQHLDDLINNTASGQHWLQLLLHLLIYF